MKHVGKAAEPIEFTRWKAGANPAWAPSYQDLQRPEKSAVHEALLSEQNWVCCYCGRTISILESHIEHFRPQAARPDLSLDYANLHASCIRETKPRMPLHCGHQKRESFDESLAISPKDLTCESRFIYTLQGDILASDESDKGAAYMISLLSLDIAFLRNRRGEVLRDVFSEDFIASATETELEKVRDGFATPDRTGRLTNFGHVVAHFSQRLLDQASEARKRSTLAEA